MSHENIPEPQDDKPNAENAPTAKRVNFDYLKSNSFRVLHVDGAWGGITPNLNIHMAVFSERHPIPKKTVMEIIEGGPLKEVHSERETRDALIREVDADLVMSLPTAMVIHKWLGDKIKELESLIQKHVQEEEEEEAE